MLLTTAPELWRITPPPSLARRGPCQLTPATGDGHGFLLSCDQEALPSFSINVEGRRTEITDFFDLLAAGDNKSGGGSELGPDNGDTSMFKGGSSFMRTLGNVVDRTLGMAVVVEDIRDCVGSESSA